VYKSTTTDCLKDLGTPPTKTEFLGSSGSVFTQFSSPDTRKTRRFAGVRFATAYTARANCDVQLSFGMWASQQATLPAIAVPGLNDSGAAGRR
jgi:hypothetical protein